jgi:hypothetical protein
LLAFAPATGGAEDIAGREVAGPQPLLQELRLGVLADTGSAKENQPPWAKALFGDGRTWGGRAFEPGGAVGFAAHGTPLRVSLLLKIAG